MKDAPALAVVAIILGTLIVIAKLASDGLTPSFMLLLGALFIADGVLRIAAHRTHEAG